jgi:large subunit ribosomal protein L14
MIQVGTRLKIADNTGAKSVQCFKILKGTRHRYARIGDIVIVSVKEAEPRKIVKKKDILRAVIVRQKKPYRLSNGCYLRFDENAAVILDGKTKLPKGNRILGPIPRILRKKGFKKITEMAKELV